MRPLSLRLVGFKGIMAGMGLSDFTLDLESLPHGLIAITGRNGGGKTTILDNLHPYRLMPWKVKDTYSPDAFSFYDQTSGENAMKELVWEFAGKVYRTRILINAIRRKQEAYLHVCDGKDWIPFSADCASGKVAAYDEAVESIIGSPSLFFTAVFRSQGARGLTSYPRAEIMGIVSEILGVDHIRVLGEKAKAVQAALSAHALETHRYLGQLDHENENAALEKELSDLKAAATPIRSRINEFEGDITATQEAIATLKAQLESVEKTAADFAQTKTSLEDKEMALSKGHGKRLEILTQNQTLRIDYNKAMEAVRARISSNKDEIARLGVIPSDDEINTKIEAAQSQRNLALEEVQHIADAQVSTNEQVEATRKEVDRLTGEYNAKISDGKTLAAKLEAAKKELESLESRAKMLSGLDCHGDSSGWVNENCPLLTDAVSAKNSITEKKEAIFFGETTINILRDEARELKSALDTAIGNLSQWKEHLAEITKTKESHQSTADKLTRDITDLMTVASHRARVDELTRDIGTREDLGREYTSFFERDTHSLKNQLKEVDELLASLEREISPLKCKLLTMGSTDPQRIAADIKTHENLIEGKKVEIAQAKATLEETIKGIATREEAVKKNIADMETLPLVKARVAAFDKMVAAWEETVIALSNRGIVALEIDDAGPMVSAMANNLLTACYGDRFTIRMVTQVEKKDGSGDKREVFDILVSDTTTGETVSLREKSGGEKTWIEDALTRALCLYTIQSSGKSFESLFTDEADGALDPEKKLNFLRIKEGAMKLGGHTREFFITQTPELVDMATAKIVLDKGGASIVF